MINILVLCTGNSARSILLEALLNAQSGGAVRAFLTTDIENADKAALQSALTMAGGLA